MRPTPLAAWLVAATTILIAASAALRAADTPATPPPAESQGLSAERIDELVRQLDDASFSKRQAASADLSQAGKQVIPVLEKAATGDSRETTVRSIDLLKKFFESGSDDAKAAAKEALTRLSTCGKPSAAARAQSVLTPETQSPQQVNPWGMPGGGIQIGGNAQIQLQVQAGVGNPARRVSIKIVNGAKEIEAEEGKRKVKINEEATGKIKMEVAEKDEQGKEKTSKYEADSAADLKKKHPEAHKIYEGYSKGAAGNIQIQAIQGNLNLPHGRRQLPLQPRIVPPRPANPQGNQDAAKRLEEARERIEAMKKELENATENPEQLKEKIQSLEDVQKQLEEAKQKLGEAG